MAKSSFLNQLGKGFVRSAVNQVGRDTGKVVSNQAYGNAHSTPIRGVNDTWQQQTPPPVNNDSPLSQATYDNKLKKYLAGWVILSVLTAGLAAIVWLVYSIVMHRKRTVKYSVNAIETVAKSDARYRAGVRYENCAVTKIIDVPLNEANPVDVKSQKKYSAISIAIAAALCTPVICMICKMPTAHITPTWLAVMVGMVIFLFIDKKNW